MKHAITLMLALGVSGCAVYDVPLSGSVGVTTTVVPGVGVYGYSYGVTPYYRSPTYIVPRSVYPAPYYRPPIYPNYNYNYRVLPRPVPPPPNHYRPVPPPPPNYR